jgi:ribosome-binding protein aMBF1 (putative translation factor)
MKRKIGLGRLEDLVQRELRTARGRKEYEQGRRSLFLAHRILALREKLGLSQGKLAAKMGTSQQAIARLESGRYEGFTLRTLERVADALGADLVIDLRRPSRKPAI